MLHRASTEMPGQKPSDRCERFFRRVDAYLPCLPDGNARRLFLDRQIAGWEQRYARFIATEGGSELVLDSADPPQAADFVLTLAGLARRRGASFTMTGDAMISNYDRRRLDGAMLSLLVAADQRCPAIIGQAHLLYHSGRDGARARAEEALTQLRLSIMSFASWAGSRGRLRRLGITRPLEVRYGFRR